MALVGAGVGLWTLAVAYRFRREAREVAEHKAAAAAAADRAKSAFLAKVSHELRTPIQSVLGYGEMLAGAPLAEPHRAWVAALRAHGDIMLRLVNDLIDLGALQSGAFQLEPAPVDLPALVADCATALRPAAAEKKLRFVANVAPGVPRWVQADGVRLRQILLNLLNNAIKFTPAGSVTLEVQPRDRDVEFVVTDSGPGIPGALRPRLFQPFARLDPAAGGGSGLGLALVQGLCAVMGGTIKLIENSAGEGATFCVRLPLPVCAPAGTPGAVPVQRGAFAGLRVLVAEDNSLVRELLAAFLREHGAEVELACDGAAAVARAQNAKPDVLLLDIALPELDGFAVAETLRRAGPPRLRIIGLSAHATRQDEARARTAGMDAFLAKPVSLARLASVLMPRADAAALAADLAAKIPHPGLRTQLASKFVEETPAILEELRAAAAAGDWPTLRRRAHYLKNSADIIGAAALQAACDRAAAMTESDDPRALVAAIEAATARAGFLILDASSTGRH
jgi:CheY-like chemotaxis protein/nitrogen-specific signal transduction histidine kinase